MTIEGKEQEFHIKDTENNFNEIIKENIPNLGKELQAHTQKGRTRKKNIMLTILTIKIKNSY